MPTTAHHHTNWVAVEGAFTGTVSFLLLLRKEWLDRPRLAVTCDIAGFPDGRKADFHLKVTNLGRRAASVHHVGFKVRPGGGEWLARDPWLTTPVAEGASIDVTVHEGDDDVFPHDSELRPFAETLRKWPGRTARYKSWYGGGWDRLLEMADDLSRRAVANQTDQRAQPGAEG